MKRNNVCKIAIGIALFSALFLSCKKKEGLRIYSIIHEEETEALTQLFTEKTGIPVVYLRATTGNLVNRVLSEKDDPQADILLGGASSYHIQAAAENALETYISPMAEVVPSYAKSEDGKWTGFCVLSLGIAINPTRFAQKFPRMEYPKTWEDLVNPAFDGEIVITDPTASSTAYLFVQNQLQRLGWDKGWDYLLKLAPLVGNFPDSGNAPGMHVGKGEFALGVSFVHLLGKYACEGLDLVSVVPPQTVGDVDCISIMKNAKNLENAKKFVDFMLSPEAQTLMSSLDWTVPVNPHATAAKGSVPLSEIDLIKYDVQLAASQKDAVLEKWNKEVR